MSNVAQVFPALHKRTKGFVMPNCWDAGSAVILAAAGFEAIATTSAGIAFAMGRQDYTVSNRTFGVGRDEMFARMRDIAAAVPVPVNGDLEAGYGDSPETVAETIRMAIGAGLAGGNIEDKMPLETRLYDETLAVERIKAARKAIDAAHSKFVLTARCDAIIWSARGIDEAIRRSNLYRAAGADCLFTPGTSRMEDIRRLAREIDGPLNMVMGLGNADGNTNDWIAAGVQRISLGGSIARAALGLVHRAGKELREQGTIAFAEGQMSQADLNQLFARNCRIQTMSSPFTREETGVQSRPAPAPPG
jgi:2-methylisocitrate lyase-like PEP mutase family enzyme